MKEIGGVVQWDQCIRVVGIVLCLSLNLTLSFLHLKILGGLCRFRWYCEIWGVVGEQVLGTEVVDLGSVDRLVSTNLVLLCFVWELDRRCESGKCSLHQRSVRGAKRC